MLTLLVLLASVYACVATDYDSSSLSKTYVKTSKWSVKVGVDMSVANNLVTLTLVGPSDKWFSVGFGDIYMDGTYCIVVDGNGDVSERQLDGKDEGDLLDFTWAVDSNVESSHYRTVVLSRAYDFAASSDSYFQFSTADSKMNTIYGYGSGADLDNHGQTQRGSESLKASRTAVKEVEAVRKESSLWGEVSTDIMEQEYEAYLTTSSILTWITCILAFCAIMWLVYQKWYKSQYIEIPDDCNSNISMVSMGSSVRREDAALV